jgi:hypothetical protein
MQTQDGLPSPPNSQGTIQTPIKYPDQEPNRIVDSEGRSWNGSASNDKTPRIGPSDAPCPGPSPRLLAKDTNRQGSAYKSVTRLGKEWSIADAMDRWPTNRASLASTHGHRLFPSSHNPDYDLGLYSERESSDSSIHSLLQRLLRHYYLNSRTQQSDPRITRIFAEHQKSLRGIQNNPIGMDEIGWDDEAHKEPVSRPSSGLAKEKES